MILIISTSNDSSTTFVIQWLDRLGKKWLRINDSDVLNLYFLGNDIKIEKNGFSFLLSSVTSCWYRRGYFKFNFGNFSNISSFETLQKAEVKNIIEYIYYILEQKKNINSLQNSNVNKLVVSSIARNLGILTPNDYLFSERNSLLEKTNTGKFITKPISGDSIQKIEDFLIFNYTTILDTEQIEGDSFFPSFVQNYIEKKYELRIFYLHGKFYSMAIFSQKDNQTNIDFRQYNENKPNRTAVFNLPKQIEIQLEQLMNELDLNCGSIDMIVTPENKYVFLEVNPVGQFGMVSEPCNYHLEKLIAQHL